MKSIKEIDFTDELSFKASRSGGKGGQNVNKVSTKVELRFNVMDSSHLTEEQKELISSKLQNRINNDGFFVISSDEKRTQLANKETVIKRFYELLDKALQKPKPRKKTKIPKAVKEKRLSDKKKKSDIKSSRSKPTI